MRPDSCRFTLGLCNLRARRLEAQAARTECPEELDRWRNWAIFSWALKGGPMTMMMTTNQTADRDREPPSELERRKRALEKAEREAETLRRFREELEEAMSIDQTSARTSLLGRHE